MPEVLKSWFNILYLVQSTIGLFRNVEKPFPTVVHHTLLWKRHNPVVLSSGCQSKNLCRLHCQV